MGSNDYSVGGRAGTALNDPVLITKTQMVPKSKATLATAKLFMVVIILTFALRS